MSIVALFTYKIKVFIEKMLLLAYTNSRPKIPEQISFPTSTSGKTTV